MPGFIFSRISVIRFCMWALRIIWRRDMLEHRSRSDEKSFTARYNIYKLIYYEGFNSIVEAIAREKFIKGKSRKWKEELIQQMNPGWNDLTGVVPSL